MKVPLLAISTALACCKTQSRIFFFCSWLSNHLPGTGSFTAHWLVLTCVGTFQVSCKLHLGARLCFQMLRARGWCWGFVFLINGLDSFLCLVVRHVSNKSALPHLLSSMKALQKCFLGNFNILELYTWKRLGWLWNINDCSGACKKRASWCNSR